MWIPKKKFHKFISMEKININGISIAAKIEGDGKKGDILLIHCLGLSHKVFDNQIKFLAQKGFRVIAPDVRCHGESDKVDSPVSIWDLTEDILKLLDKIGIKKLFLLGGISMGGMISMRMILKRPDIAQNLVLMGTSADQDPYKERYIPMIEDMLNTLNNEKDPEKIKQTFRNSAEFVVRLCFSHQYLEKDNNFEIWVNESLKGQSLGAIYVSKAVITRDSILDQIEKIKVPTLVMVGSNDIAVPPRESEKIAQRIKNSKLVILDGAPHIFPPEIPDRTNAEISSFVSI